MAQIVNGTDHWGILFINLKRWVPVATFHMYIFKSVQNLVYLLHKMLVQFFYLQWEGARAPKYAPGTDKRFDLS